MTTEQPSPSSAAPSAPGPSLADLEALAASALTPPAAPTTPLAAPAGADDNAPFSQPSEGYGDSTQAGDNAASPDRDADTPAQADASAPADSAAPTTPLADSALDDMVALIRRANPALSLSEAARRAESALGMLPTEGDAAPDAGGGGRAPAQGPGLPGLDAPIPIDDEGHPLSAADLSAALKAAREEELAALETFDNAAAAARRREIYALEDQLADARAREAAAAVTAADSRAAAFAAAKSEAESIYPALADPSHPQHAALVAAIQRIDADLTATNNPAIGTPDYLTLAAKMAANSLGIAPTVRPAAPAARPANAARPAAPSAPPVRRGSLPSGTLAASGPTPVSVPLPVVTQPIAPGGAGLYDLEEIARRAGIMR